jgi:hypothetical protein
MGDNWQSLSPDQKLNTRLDAWLAAENVPFVDPQSKNAYRERVQRIIETIRLGKPDRVTINPRPAFFPAVYGGITAEQAMYDYARTAEIWQKYTLDFEPDLGPGTGVPGSGKALEYLEYKLYRWPGHGVPANVTFQYVESENMKPGEYDDLIHDPSYFLMRKFLSRICGKLDAFQKLPPLFTSVELGTFFGGLIAFGDPNVQAGLHALMQAGDETARWAAAVSASDRKIASWGFPAFSGGYAKAPFDTIGDTLRGTVGIAMDMYRQPAKVLKAVEQLTPLMIELGTSRATLGGSPIIMIPLHKGADGFMSDEQYKKFYWPTLKEVVLGLIEQGLIPCLFAEGGYNSRLEIIKDLPSGKVIWYFDQIDMQKAKDIVGRTSCIMGNVPLSLLISGSQDEVRQFCQKLIDVAGKNGGFIMAPRSSIDIANADNLKVMIQTCKTYGRYSGG